MAADPKPLPRRKRWDGTMAQQWSVLVVSEEASAIQSIADTLIKRDYRVLTAPQGDKARALLERETVHVVVTDLTMRRVSGLDV
jgi:DNA-binding response OmpR family regulator